MGEGGGGAAASNCSQMGGNMITLNDKFVGFIM